jgi:hypothetical protein
LVRLLLVTYLKNKLILAKCQSDMPGIFLGRGLFFK